MTTATRRPQVLVVDDDALVRFALMEILAEAGIEAIEAANSLEALSAIAAAEDLRLMVTDIDMPGSINGLGLVRLVRERCPYLGIVVISGQPMQGHSELPDDITFMQKPFSFERLTDLA